MKLIIFKPYGSLSSALSYTRSVRIAYMLNIPFASAGISEQDHNLMQYAKSLPIEAKAKFMIKCLEPGDELRDCALLFDESQKEFKAAKHKNSKHIIAFQKLKKTQDKLCQIYFEHRYKYYNDTFKVGIMAGLINPDKFFFYDLKSDLVPLETKSTLTNTQLLRLLLPDNDNRSPLFVLDRSKMHGAVVADIELNQATSILAEDPEMTYVQYAFTFPMVEGMSANEIVHARNQLEQTTLEFRQKVALWAAICYQSPNTNEGLEYFRENLNSFLPTLSISTMQSATLQNISTQTREKSETLLFIGQVPIQMIWQYFLGVNAITEEEYNELMQIKIEQYPKYEGRWPVMFTSFLVDDLNPAFNDHHLTQFRKTISVD